MGPTILCNLVSHTHTHTHLYICVCVCYIKEENMNLHKVLGVSHNMWGNQLLVALFHCYVLRRDLSVIG